MSQEQTSEQMSIQTHEKSEVADPPSGGALPSGETKKVVLDQPTPSRRSPVRSAEPIATGTDILGAFSAGMGGLISREVLLSDLFSQTLLFANAAGGCLLEQDADRLFLVAHKGLPDEKVQHLSNYGVSIPENGDGRRTIKLSDDASPDGAPCEVSWEIPIASSARTWGLLCFLGTPPLLAQERSEKVSLLQKGWQTALDHLQWTDASRRQIEVLKMANTLAQSAAQNLPLEPCLGDLAHRLATMVGAQHAYFFVVDEKRSLLCGVAATHNRGNAIREMEIPLDADTLVALTAREKHPLVIRNAREDSRVDKKWLRLFNARCLLSIPLLLKERVIGVFLLDDTRHFKRFGPKDVDGLVALTAPVSAALDHAIRHQAVLRQMDRLQSLSLSMVDLQEEERRRIAQTLRQETDKKWTEMKRGLSQIEQEIACGETPQDTPQPGVSQPEMQPSDGLSEAVMKAAPVAQAVREEPKEKQAATKTALLAAVRNLQAQATRTREEMQKIANDLRPALLDSGGLLPTLRWYLDAYSKRTRIAANLQSSGAQKRLPPRIELFLYRLTQEALTNVAKHAQAKSVILNLEKKELYAHLSITDDGKGFDVKRSSESTPPGKRGLFWIKEQVDMMGGKLFIDSGTGRGTRLSVKLPIIQQVGSSDVS